MTENDNAVPEFARLEVPARAEFVSVLRLVVGAAAANYEWLRTERLDDLKLAISEACIALMAADAVTIQLTTYASQAQLDVELSAGGASAARSLPDNALEGSTKAFEFGTPLVSMLVDQVTVSRESDTVKLTVLRDPEIVH